MNNKAITPYIVRRDNRNDLKFDGVIVASVNSRMSDDQVRWTELTLYQTRSGTYICHEVGCSAVDGEQALSKGAVAPTTKEVIDFFGHKWLAKQLYLSAGIEAAVHVA